MNKTTLIAILFTMLMVLGSVSVLGQDLEGRVRELISNEDGQVAASDDDTKMVNKPDGVYRLSDRTGYVERKQNILFIYDRDGNKDGKISNANADQINGFLSSKTILDRSKTTFTAGNNNYLLSNNPTAEEIKAKHIQTGTVLTASDGRQAIVATKTVGRSNVNSVVFGSTDRNMFVAEGAERAYEPGTGNSVEGYRVILDDKKYGLGNGDSGIFIPEDSLVRYTDENGATVIGRADDEKVQEALGKKSTIIIGVSDNGNDDSEKISQAVNSEEANKHVTAANAAWIKITKGYDENDNQIRDTSAGTVDIGGEYHTASVSEIEYTQFTSTFPPDEGFVFLPGSMTSEFAAGLSPGDIALHKSLRDQSLKSAYDTVDLEDGQTRPEFSTFEGKSGLISFGTNSNINLPVSLVAARDDGGALIEHGAILESKGTYAEIQRDKNGVLSTVEKKESSLIVKYSDEVGENNGIVNEMYVFNEQGQIAQQGFMKRGVTSGGLIGGGESQNVMLFYQNSYDEKGKLIGTYLNPTYGYPEGDKIIKLTYNEEKKEWQNPDGKKATIPEEQKELFSDIKKRKDSTIRRIFDSADRTAGWSTFSSLFCQGECFSEWSKEVDEIFHNEFLGGSDYWTETICKENVETSNENAILSLSSDGMLYSSAMIHATKQRVSTEEGTKYLYRVSFFLQNPSSQKSSGLLGGLLGDDKIKGKKAKFDSSDLERDDKKIWNVIKKGSQEISNANAQNSQTATNENYEFNVEFTGGNTYNLFPEIETLEPGDEISYLGEDSFASYSDNQYDKVCIKFEGTKPRNAFFEDIDEVCTTIKDTSSTAPTFIDIEENRGSRETSNDLF